MIPSMLLLPLCADILATKFTLSRHFVSEIRGMLAPESAPRRVSVWISEVKPLRQQVVLEFLTRLDDVHIALTDNSLHQGVQLLISRVYHTLSFALEE